MAAVQADRVCCATGAVGGRPGARRRAHDAVGTVVGVRPRIIESGFVEFLMERLRVFPIFDARNELQR